MAGLTLGVFYGCQKKEFDLQNDQTQLSQTGSGQIRNAVSIDEAKQAYDEYLKQKPKVKSTLSARGSNDLESQVVWESAQNFGFSDTSGNLIAASADVYIKGEYKKAFFVRIHDTVKLLQVYVHPTDEYMKRSKGVIKMSNFDGLVGYKNDHDVLIGGYKIINGKIEYILTPKTNNPNNVGGEEPTAIVLDGFTVTATRPTTLWNGYFDLNPVTSGSSSSGPSIGSNGSSTGGGGGSSTGSTGAAAGDSPYSEVVIPSYLFQSRNPQDVLSEMGLSTIEITFVTVKNVRIGIQIGEAIDALGLEDSKATIRAFTNLVRTNTPFKIANVASNYNIDVILALDRYLKAGFNGLEFAQLWLNPSLFAQVDGFLQKHSFQNDEYADLAKKHSISYLNDADYRQTVDQYNQLASSGGGGSPFSSIMTEIAKVVLKKILKKAIPEWEIADELIDASAHFATGEYLDLLGDCVTIGKDLAKASAKVVNPWVLTAIAAIEGAPIVKKGLDLYDRFDAIYNQLSSQVFNGVFKAFSTFKFSNNKDWFDSIENVLENRVEKNLQFNGSLQSFFNHLKNQFPGASTGTYRNSPYIQVGNVFIRFYTESATSSTPTISFTVNDVKPIQDGGTGIIIIKFRQP
jgi:hypothetical protein